MSLTVNACCRRQPIRRSNVVRLNANMIYFVMGCAYLLALAGLEETVAFGILAYCYFLLAAKHV